MVVRLVPLSETQDSIIQTLFVLNVVQISLVQKQENKHNKYLDQTCTITYVCVCQCVVGFVIIYHQFVPTRLLPSHNVVSSPPGNTHLLYHIPILEAVFHESTIKWVLVSTVCSPEMPVTPVVCSLVCGEIEYDCVQLQGM